MPEESKCMICKVSKPESELIEVVNRHTRKLEKVCADCIVKE